MKKVRIAQATLLFGITAGVIVAVPGLVWRVGARNHSGLILVNGRIEGTEVALGTKLPGRVRAVLAEEGQQVRAGQLIAELEADDVQAAYDQAQAEVSRARHNLENAHEQVIRSKAQLSKAKIAYELKQQQTVLGISQADAAVKGARAGVAQAKAMRNKARTTYDRAKKLYEEKSASELEFAIARETLAAHEAAVDMAERKLDQAVEAYKLAEAGRSEIEMYKRDLEVMESTVRQAEAAVRIAEAQVKAAEAMARIFEIKLKDTKVHAPCDGVVVTRVVEPGEVVPAGATLAVLIDFDKLYLKGYLPNKLIGKVKLNDPARVYLDAFEDRYFEARVTKVHQQAEFTPKNVDTPQQRVKLVFGIELRVDNKERLVKPGMPADAVVKIDDQAQWQVPKALR